MVTAMTDRTETLKRTAIQIRRDIMDIAAHCGCSAIIGCDAHSPEYLKDKKLYERTRAIAEKRGMKILDYIDF